MYAVQYIVHCLLFMGFPDQKLFSRQIAEIDLWYQSISNYISLLNSDYVRSLEQLRTFIFKTLNLSIIGYHSNDIIKSVQKPQEVPKG